jgi:ABC-type spermidine/putrescine transport system permease subunit II
MTTPATSRTSATAAARAAEAASGDIYAARAPAAGRTRRIAFDRPRTLWVVTGLTLVLLYLPLAVVLAYSFNATNSLSNLGNFGLRWYRTLFHDQAMLSSLSVSIQIALIATAGSVVLGTMLAFGLRRGLRSVARATNATVFLRIVTPETATGVAMLLLFTQLGVTLSTTTIIISHIALCVAFVTVVIYSRLVLLNDEIEDSAMDLGATRLQAVWLVAIPVLWPAIIASALLAFVLSFDDFITSYFTSGLGVPPLPVRIYGMLRSGVTPEVNAIGVFMLIITGGSIILAAVIVRWFGRRRVLSPYGSGHA